MRDPKTDQRPGDVPVAKRGRLRAPFARPGELVMRWGKMPHDNPDMCFSWGDGASKRDASFLHSVLCAARPDPFKEQPFAHMRPSVLEELSARGYDLTTLRFSVRKARDAEVLHVAGEDER